tara:strand:- start:54 stop:452 length:399 start_codon:yes stop_codon:yes gene_type:complete
MANGTIAFDTLQTSGQITGTAKSVDTDYILSGVPKQWLHFNQDTPAIRNSLNTTSVTDNETGKFTPTITAGMSGTEYIVLHAHTAEDTATNNFSQTENQNGVTSTTYIRSTFENGSRRDEAFSVSSAIGDLA